MTDPSTPRRPRGATPRGSNPRYPEDAIRGSNPGTPPGPSRRPTPQVPADAPHRSNPRIPADLQRRRSPFRRRRHVAVNARRIATGMAASATLAIVAVMGLARHQTATTTTNVVTTGGSTDVGQPVATLPQTDDGWQTGGWQSDDGWQTDEGQSAVTLPQAQSAPSVSVAPPTVRQNTTPIASTHGSR